MTPVELIAVIFAVILLVKLVSLAFISTKGLKAWVKKVTKYTGLLQVLCLAFVVLLGYYLLMEISIVQLWVASMFGIFIYAMVFLSFPKAYQALADEFFKSKSRLSQAWLPFLIWAVLAIWVLCAIYK